jgi:hypothetical protein
VDDATTAEGDAAPPEQESGGPDDDLSPFEILDAASERELAETFERYLAAITGRPGGAPELWERVARHTGSHCLKTTDPKIGEDDTDGWIFSPDEGCAASTARRRTYAFNGAWNRYAKILLKPVALAGSDPVAVVDVIGADRHPVARAFAQAAGAEAGAAVRRGLAGSVRASQVRRAVARRLPMMYAPDGRGGELLLTPVVSTEAFVNLSLLPKRFAAWRREADLGTVRVSGKAQNAGTHLGAFAGMRRRLRADTPDALPGRRVAIARFLASGKVPTTADVGDRLAAIADLLATSLGLPDTSSQGEPVRQGYTNVDIRTGLTGHVRALVEAVVEDLEDFLKDVATVMDGEPSAATCADARLLLSPNAESDERLRAARRGAAWAVVRACAGRRDRERPPAKGKLGAAAAIATPMLVAEMDAALERRGWA